MKNTFVTTNYVVTSTPPPKILENSNIRVYEIRSSYSGWFYGTFEASVSEDKYKNICIMNFCFESSSALSIFEEVFTGYSEITVLPIYFNKSKMEAYYHQSLFNIGATKVDNEVDNELDDTVWHSELGTVMFKLKGKL